MDEQQDLWPSGQATQRSGYGGLSWLAVRAVAVTGAVALIAGILIGPIVAGKPVPALGADTQTPEHTIAVSGSGSVSLTPDVADITIGVSVDKPTAKEARQSAATTMSAVLAAVKKDGVADKDIVTIDVGLQPVYEYSGSSVPRLVAQRFSNTVRITVRDLDKLPAVVDDSVSAGATVVSGIAFRVNDPKGPQSQARLAAMQDARAKADALAQAAGVSIKGVASVSETSYTPSVPVAYADKAAAGAVSTPIQTGTTTVVVNVQVAYLIG